MNIKEYIKKLNNWIRQQTILDSPDIVATNSGDGWNLRFREPLSSNGDSSSTGTESSYPCKITGVPTGGVYPVDLYDEVDGTKQGEGYLLPLNLHVSEVLSVDTWVVAVPSQVTGLTWSED